MSAVPPASEASAARAEWFLLATCRGGGEAALAAWQERVIPGLRRAAWRRGLVTFRGTGDPPADDLLPELVFARTCVRSLGQVTGLDDRERAAAAVALAGGGPWQRVHVWNRVFGIEADPPAIARLVGNSCGVADPAAATLPGDLVLDIVIDSPQRWWIGRHRAGAAPSTWPGGLSPAVPPEGCASRAWLKIDEALAVFGLAPRPGERAIELGASPGGACQRLLEAGLRVVGVDPAPVASAVAAHPRFTQWRARARDLKRRAFCGCDWLVCDMNIDPTSTLRALERILTAPGVRPRGVIATFKLPEWSRAAELPGWLAAFGRWGYRARARQLSTGGREVCVAAGRRT